VRWRQSTCGGGRLENARNPRAHLQPGRSGYDPQGHPRAPGIEGL